MGVIRRRTGGQPHDPVGPTGDDGLDGVHGGFEVRPEADLIPEHVAGEPASGGGVRREDASPGVAGLGVPDGAF